VGGEKKKNSFHILIDYLLSQCYQLRVLFNTWFRAGYH